jgi:hypothetical protein
MSVRPSSKKPKTFAEVMHNPQRKFAEGTLATVLLQLERLYGIDHTMLADILFDYLIQEMQPRDPMTHKDVMVWVGQLQRFRDAADTKLETIKDIYKNTPHTSS